MLEGCRRQLVRARIPTAHSRLNSLNSPAVLQEILDLAFYFQAFLGFRFDRFHLLTRAVSVDCMLWQRRFTKVDRRCAVYQLPGQGETSPNTAGEESEKPKALQ